MANNIKQYRIEIQLDNVWQQLTYSKKPAAPRLLRYVGTMPTQRMPFMQRTLPLAKSAWDGPLCWDGVGGAVATYCADTIKRAVVGHLARIQLPLSPALYQALGPGRRAYLFGVSYTVESMEGFDVADELALATVELSREVF